MPTIYNIRGKVGKLKTPRMTLHANGRSLLPLSRPLIKYLVLLYLISAVIFIKYFRQPIQETVASILCTKTVKVKEISKSVPRVIGPINIGYIDDNFLKLDQQDPELINYARIKYLTPPSKLPYILKAPLSEPMHYADNFSLFIAELFQNKTNGVFVEAGAREGENGSHTLMLELNLKWSGLLVECNPTLVPKLRKLHRKAWIGEVCLSTEKTPGVHNFFNPNSGVGWKTNRVGTAMNKTMRKEWILYEVNSVPLYTLLAAIGCKEIDFLTLSVEGTELEILESLPSDSITINVLTVEEHFIAISHKLYQLDTTVGKLGLRFVGRIEQNRVYIHTSLMRRYLAMKPHLRRHGLH